MSPREAQGVLKWNTVLDNYEPVPRNFANGEGLIYLADEDMVETITLDTAQLKDPHKAIYLLDDGHNVEAWYVAGYKEDGTHVHIHRFPLDYNDDGTARTRKNDGRPVNFSTWILGPRRAYHLKVTREMIA